MRNEFSEHSVRRPKVIFDAYKATIPASPEEVLGVLREVTGADGERMQGKPRGFYDYGHSFIDPRGRQFAFVKSGGRHQYPHVECQGDNSAAFAEVVREAWPVHSVSRCDPKIDFCGVGCFERVDAVLVAYALAEGIKLDRRGEWERGNNRTRYVGSNQSTTLIRWYEKAHLWAKQGLIVDDLTVCRLEFQQQPGQKKLGAAAATMSAEECIGLSKLGVAAYRLVAGVEVEYLKAAPEPKTTIEQRADNLVRQYGATLDGLLERLRDPAAVGAYLYELKRQAAERKAA